MSNIWITSDFHFGHNKEFLYKPRGFNSIQEHDEALIANFNALVNPEDDVYILGDLCLNDTDHGIECLRRLHGKLHIILGNHDTANRIERYTSLPAVQEIQYALPLHALGHHFYLSHYPALVSNYDSDKPLKARTISLCGHSHTKDPFADWDKGLIVHCEVDAHYNLPTPLYLIIDKIKQKLSSETSSSLVGAQRIIDRHRFITTECDKCVHSNYCGPRPYEDKCPPGMKFKRDPPDGGYYG